MVDILGQMGKIAGLITGPADKAVILDIITDGSEGLLKFLDSDICGHDVIA